ncbi:transmembrane protein 199 [Genypterus blacodes]|uniref:transmembrane protein 199 n=1 Tax=Genypterus blacodes TaxID=154954 RepID=UPI003F76375F
MVSSFTGLEPFQNRFKKMFECREPPLPQGLREELQALDKPEPIILPFNSARKIQKYLQDAGHPFYLHELLEAGSLHLPSAVTPPRNPELVARLERIKAKLANEEYNRITRNVNTQEINRNGTLADFGRQARSVKALVVTVLNFLVTVVAAFACSYMGSQYLFTEAPARIISAVIGASVVGLAELYVLVRTMEGDVWE